MKVFSYHYTVHDYFAQMVLTLILSYPTVQSPPERSCEVGTYMRIQINELPDVVHCVGVVEL